MEFWGQKIKEFRLSLGWDVQKFADKLGCKPGNIYRIERCENLSEQKIRSIAKTLGVEVPTLLGYNDIRVEEMAEVYGDDIADADKFFQRVDMLKVISAEPQTKMKDETFKNLEETFRKIRKKQKPGIK